MLFFLIELDEERILKDDLIDLEAAYESIDATFAQRDVTLYKKVGAKRYYTRNIDKDDFSCLWIVNMAFRDNKRGDANWFGYYIKDWRFIITDDETGKIKTNEDVLIQWKNRPTKL